MMRGPSNWAVAVRKPDGRSRGLAARSTPSMKRHWIFRLPVIRGIIALGESLAIGFRALAISAQLRGAGGGRGGRGDETELSRGAIIFAFVIAIGFAISLFKVDAGAAHRPARRSPTRFGFVIVEGLIRVSIFIALPVADLAAARPAARLPVPRGRAQGDQRLRGRRGAGAAGRAALQPDPPSLRHRVPALGDGDRDLRVRVLRAAAAGTG